jgi:hypothetical protein
MVVPVIAPIIFRENTPALVLLLESPIFREVVSITMTPDGKVLVRPPVSVIE